jgi:MAP kinase interacting serine/threonine kinase
MDNVWLFPSSYNEWEFQQNNHNTNGGGGDIKVAWDEEETHAERPLMTKDLIAEQPAQSDIVEKPRRKKKKRSYPERQLTFHDKYTLSAEILGEGANSVVVLARENCSGQDFAVKIIDKYDGYDRSRVLREIDLLHFLSDCPNVLHLHDSYEENDRFYVVFKKMDGGPLLHHIQNKKFFTEREASLVVKDIAVALKFLHDHGISHRDLKPDNILCVNEDEIVPIVICDFNLASGISTIRGDTTPELYTPVGSAEFMAPEVVDAFVRDAPAYDKRCDLWSLGVILYIMLSGRPPFQGNCDEDCDWDRGGSCRECQSELWHSILNGYFNFPEEEFYDVSFEAKDLISHLLVKDASKRYSVDMVLSHPWLKMASNNILRTPSVLSSEVHAHRLSAVTSEAVAYRRIISERQRKEEERQVITRWSTPPKFHGLSPPGNSRLAKRRSLKRLNFNNNDDADNPTTTNNTTPPAGDDHLDDDGGGGVRTLHSDSGGEHNDTPTDSPDSPHTLLCRDFERRLRTHLSSTLTNEPKCLSAPRFSEPTVVGLLDSSPEDLVLAKKIEF